LGESQTLQEHLELASLHVVLSFVTYALGTSYRMRRDLTAQLKRSEIDRARFRGLFDANNDAVFICDLNLTILDVNDRALSMLGYSRSELVGKPYAEIVAPDEQADLNARFAASTQGDWLPFYERTYIRKDGRPVVVEINGGMIRDETGLPLHYQTISRDITLRKAAEQELYNKATHDELTGLFNRTMFFELLKRSIARATRDKHQLAVLFFDLDGFKKANDTFGHHVGDLLLKAVAERISDLLRKADTLARIGGDEFTVILEKLNDRQAADTVAHNIEEVLAKPFALEGHQVQIGASVGIAIYPDDGIDPEKLVNTADGEMYRNKRSKYAKNLGWPLVF
jgi:diguanylate cyclase (GGDEF)-like protein/PAS domain S-box-containing protein